MFPSMRQLAVAALVLVIVVYVGAAIVLKASERSLIYVPGDREVPDPPAAGNAPTRAASRSSRARCSRTAASGTSPERTAATSASPHGPVGPGIFVHIAYLTVMGLIGLVIVSDRLGKLLLK